MDGKSYILSYPCSETVRLISQPHEELKRTFNSLPQNIFVDFMLFTYSPVACTSITRAQFDDYIRNQWHIFRYFEFTTQSEQREFLIEKFSNSFNILNIRENAVDGVRVLHLTMNMYVMNWVISEFFWI